MKYLIVKTTCYSEKEAKFIANELVVNKLAACVQISKIESFYMWNERVCDDEELLLSIKIRKDNYKKVEEIILKNNSYEIPQVIACEVVEASKEYLKWIDESSV